MQYQKFYNTIVLRLDKGEEIIESITEVCEKENVTLASVSGIGAVNEIEIGLFKTKEKKYYSTKEARDFEILSLSGNISTMDNKVYPHLHITVSDETYGSFGGHLNYAKISATAEIIITIINTKVDRLFDEETGLNLLKL